MIFYGHGGRYVFIGSFQLFCGVRQGGVLSPILFCVYVDCIIQRLQESKLGCWLGEVHVSCILYADDVILISSSTCELQNVCVWMK